MIFAKKCLAGLLIACQLMPLHTYAQSEGDAQRDTTTAQRIQQVSEAALAGGEGLQQWASDYASDSATHALREAIAPFGTLHGNLTLESDLSLRSAELDALLPVYDRAGLLVFTQVGTRKNADRLTTNMGFGSRYFFADTMLGVNAFYDVQWKPQHQRVGLGVEWWRDNLKLAANGYLRLSDWVQSSTWADYDERPADGWDIRAHGWLPAHPQLGGKLTFAQYYGEGVTLFGDNERQANPFALTAGLSYTPFPLLTAEVEHRIGAQGVNDTRLSLGVNLQLGAPWSQQLDPRGVTRTLLHQRYDAVNRNNDIVLNTRKQTLITLSLPAQIVGLGGEQVTLTPTIYAKHGVSHVVLQEQALQHAGGRILQRDARRIELQLPEQAAPVVLGVTAYDTRGNASQTQYVQLITRTVAGTHLTLTASEQVVPVSRAIRLTVVATDVKGQPLRNEAVQWRSDNGELTGQAQTDAQGRATATLRSAHAGDVHVIAQVKGQAVTSARLTFTAEHHATLRADKRNAVADGNEAVRYSLSVRDAQGQPVANTPVQWSSNVGALSDLSHTTDAQGVAHASLTSTTAGIAAVSVRGAGFSASAPFVTFTDSLSGTLTGAERAYPHTALPVTLQVRDAAGRPVPDIAVTWQLTPSASTYLTPATGKTDAQGQLTVNATMYSSEGGIYTLSARFAGQTLSHTIAVTNTNPARHATQ